MSDQTALQVSLLKNIDLDPRLLMAAKAIQIMSGKDKETGAFILSEEAAIAAAVYQAGTGQLVGRDFYMNEKTGRMEGYRGAARDAADRGAGELQIEYRPLRAEEAEEHEVKPGDVAYACDVFQLRAWRIAQKMGQPYRPITGIGILRKMEKYDKKSVQRWNDQTRHYDPQPESQWRQISLEGGMTWAKKAKNRAYKDALRHVPGAPSSAEEVLEEGALRGAPMPPENARLSLDQAQEWVRQNVVDGEVTDVTGQSHSNGNGHTAEPPPDDGWNEMPSVSEERRARPAAQPQPQAQPVGNPKCPQCDGPMWDNREKVAQAVRDGRKPGPEWACKAGKYNPETRSTDGCDGKLWAGEWPPRQHPSEEQVNGLLKLVKEVYPNPGDKAAFRDWIAQMFGVNVETASSVRELLNKLTPAQAETAANELDATLRQMTAQV